MNIILKKTIIVFCIAAVFFANNACAQDSCYNCNIDSLTAAMKMAKSNNEKIKLLTLLSDLKLASFSQQTDTETTGYIQSLIELSKSQKVKDIDAYKSLLEALYFFKKRDFLNAQNSFKISIALFDKSHKKIPAILAITRLTYNEAGDQEDRYKFYTDKLQYYLIDGPIENVASCYHAIGGYYLYKADYNLAISNYLKAAAIYKNYDNKYYRNDLAVVADTYLDWGNYQKASEYFNKVIPISKIAKDSFQLGAIYISLSRMNLSLGNYTEALLFSDTALLFINNRYRDQFPIACLEKALALIGLKKLNEGLYTLGYTKKIADSTHTKIFSASGAFELDFGYYQYYSSIIKYSEAGKYLVSAYEKSVDVKSNELQLKYLRELSLFYGQQHNSSLEFYYTKKFFDLRDKLDKDHSSFKVAQYENEEKEIKQNDSINVLKQEGAIQAATIKKNNTILWGSLVAIIFISVSLFFVYRQYRMNKKTLLSLRKTQRQLIQSEKMASLGELTAGIAHEIQNPLNFVNNFSEVSNELLSEMVDEANNGNIDEVKAIANNVQQNLEKILHHGKRADAIVKGMLQHSRSSTGVKEQTDINALADEYLRLSYHGLRAKDKNFNAEIKTDFDKSIDKTNIIPQDIGRVLLNLYNNAFYVVSEKKKSSEAGYEPTVSVSTKKIGDKVEVRVKDNGNGIPQKVVDKIFQPFFTTKPTGQGTGLGLSLSYDIVKAHGGEIKVESKEGEGSEFIIQLPNNKA